MRTSESTNEISAALAAAQGELDPAPKDSINPHFKSSYADLASCRRVSQPVLAKHGLAVVQAPLFDFENGMVGITTRLTHKTGQYFESDTWCKPQRGLGPQDVGSAITYLRRYGYSAIIGLVADADDDGHAAQGKRDDQPPPPQEPPPDRTPKYRHADKACQDWIKGRLETTTVPKEGWKDFSMSYNGQYMTDLAFEVAVAKWQSGADA